MIQHKITTPELVHFQYQIAGLVTRAMAWSVDQIILMLMIAVVVAVAARTGKLGLALIFFSKFALDFGYWSFFELRRTGQTPGKRLFGIRVIGSRGGKLQFSDVIIRTLFRMIDNPMLIPFLGVVGAIVALIDPLHRRLGDLAADTIVIRDAKVTLPSAMLAQQSRVNTFSADAGIRSRVLTRVTREERDMMLDLMLRRDGLEPETREMLFQQAANHFRQRYNLPEDHEYLSDEQTVLNLALVVQEAKITG